MKILLIFLSLLLILQVSSVYGQIKKLPGELKTDLGEMKFIEADTILLGGKSFSSLMPDEKDSTLLFYKKFTGVEVPAFLMCQHEVTNTEYRKFTNWVRDSIARTILAEKDPGYYDDAKSKRLDWSIPIDWMNEALTDRLFKPDTNKMNSYKKKVLDVSKLIYTLINDSSDTISCNIYPDTTRWIEDFKYSLNEPLTNMYFWHPAYNNYPVVCVTWRQAWLYCQWINSQLSAILKKYNIPAKEFARFRLPTQAEWEVAATNTYTDKKNIKRLSAFPWNGDYLTDENGKYFANFGRVLDKNRFLVKFYDGDGYMHTSPVEHYPPNCNGLYDMSGNVAEWVMDRPVQLKLYDSWEISQWADFISERPEMQITEKDNAHTAMKRIIELIEHDRLPKNRDTINLISKSIMLDFCEQLVHDWNVINKTKNPRIVKGGSWADSPAYILTGSSEVFDENKSSCRIGFRLAMEVPEHLIPLFKKK